MTFSTRHLILVLLLPGAALAAACGDGAAPEEEPIGAASLRLTGPEIDAVAQSGVTWVVGDTVSWTQANQCDACHRVGGPTYGASLAAYTGYNVDTTAASGTGWLARFLAVNEQEGSGGWSHFGSFAFSTSGYAIYGLAGYTEYTSTAYLSDLQQGVDWAMVAAAPYTFSFGNDGLAHAGKTTRFIPQDHGAFPTTGSWIIPTSQFAVAARTLTRVNTALTPAQQAAYNGYADSLADSLEAQFARGGASWQTVDVANAALGAAAVGRAPAGDPSLAAMRDLLLARHNLGQGWSDDWLGGQNVLSTAQALYALCVMGVRSDESQAVFDGIDWLADQQCDAGNGYCGTGSAYYDGSWSLPGHAPDLPSIYAVLAMACYGTLNVGVSLTPSAATMQPLEPAPQTASFTVRVTNTGYAANTYALTLGGSWAGISSLTQDNPAFTLQPNEAASSVVTVTLAPNQPGSVVIPITTTVSYATSSGPATKTVTYRINIPEQPTPSAAPTTTTIVAGNGAIVSAGATAHLAASVRGQNNLPILNGTVTFYGGGSAIATVAADESGVFSYDWLVPSSAPQGLQAFSATFGGFATPDFAVNLAPSSANGTFTVGNDVGVVCQFDVDCLSGHCVDGVCCNSACGGNNANDCQACSVAAGAAVNGTCSVRAAGAVCRASSGACDPAETCDGSATACPSDVALPPEQCASGCVTVQRGLEHGAVDDGFVETEATGDPTTATYPLLLSGNRWPIGYAYPIARFDLSFIPANATVVSSTLSVFQNWSWTPDATVSVKQLLLPWTEPTGTYGNFGPSGFGDTVLAGLSPLDAADYFGFRSADLKALTQGWVSGAIANRGVYLDSGEIGLEFFSSEHTSEELRPKLEVCYYPFP